MTGTEYFRYTSLRGESSIRLIVLDPESADGVIRCRLEEHSIGSLPVYESLSYEWGMPPDHDRPIFINFYPHLVRKNLYDGLLHLSHKTKERRLWIDAICINQADLQERNSQVQLMGTIYSKARDVLVWLGLSDEDSDIAMPYLKDISHLHKMRGTRAKDVGPQKAHIKQIEAVSTLCNWSYWPRIWIVQEIQFAKHLVVHCGPQSLSWSELSRACSFIVNSPGIRHLEAVKSIRTSIAIKLLLSEDVKHMQLRNLLAMYANSLCTDSRDKIYALVGLAEDARGLLIPDYCKTLSQVYRDVVKAHTREGVAVDDIFQFSEFLQSTLCKPHEKISLPDNDIDTLWIRVTRCGTITDLDQSSYDFASSTKVLSPKNVLVSTPVATSEEQALQEESITALPESSLRIISHETELQDKKIILPTYSAEDQIDTISTQSRRSTGMSSKDGKIAASARDFVAGEGKDRLIGAAPTQARIGDMVFSMQNSTVSLIVRAEGVTRKMIGRANLFRLQHETQETYGMGWEGSNGAPYDLKKGKDAYIQLTYALLQKLTAE